MSRATVFRETTSLPRAPANTGAASLPATTSSVVHKLRYVVVFVHNGEPKIVVITFVQRTGFESHIMPSNPNSPVKA